MLQAMRTLGRDLLALDLDKQLPKDPESWYQQLRNERPQELFPYLVEDNRNIERIYVLEPDPHNAEIVHLSVRDNTEEEAKKCPFNQPSGSQSAALGPVLKRSFAKKGPGPSPKILNTTYNAFQNLAQKESAWADYFAEITSIIERPKLRFEGQEHTRSDSQKTILEVAVAVLPEKKVCFLTVADKAGKLPGERPEYLAYLSEILAQTKYTNADIPPQMHQTCPLCGDQDTTVYPNGLRGAGINFLNMDRDGAFPNLLKENAWKGFAICLPCADLLYIYKHHFHKNFLQNIAGSKALLIPSTTLNQDAKREWYQELQGYIAQMEKAVEGIEGDLLELLTDEQAIASIDILWASFGQYIDDVKGVLHEVLPSRLHKLSQLNREANAWQHPIFPEEPLPEADFTLSLSCLGPLLKREGGKKNQALNDSKRLFALRREIAAAVYHGRPLAPARFWQEVMKTAQTHLEKSQEYPSGLLYEGVTTKKKERKVFLTLAGWVRHLARLIFYLRKMELWHMPRQIYEPTMDGLKPYFGPESGVDSNEKAFAFLLGMLYGKVLEIQGARGVNVGANALTWLKRLTLSGKDLPELYVKIREKLLAYEAEKSAVLRDLIHEIGTLGARLGDDIQLDKNQTCYFLLLGQSLTRSILKKQEEPKHDAPEATKETPSAVAATTDHDPQTSLF